ncbi:hypothetical protein ACH44C_27420 [Streptomyces purpureus]|uniref:hypothetical protein n=1 Tax=Streptomyces purpureus TaxID=1951 RepID=UPI0003A587CD
MGGMQDKHRPPGKSREERERRQPSQDPVHPESGRSTAGKSPEEMRRRRENGMTDDEDDLRDDES